MVKSFSGGQVIPGDLIAVANGNYLTVAVAAGEGKGTLQYWSLNALCNAEDWYERNPDINKKPFSRGHLWKSRILSTESTRLMILNESIFTTKEEIEKLQKAKDVLRKLDIPFNF